MDNKQLIAGICKGDKRCFELLFDHYYVFLCLIAEQIVHDEKDAEEIVSDVFVKLWNNREQIVILGSIRAYLSRAVHNTALNYLEKNKQRNQTSNIDQIPSSLIAWEDNYPLGEIFEKELLSLFNKSIHALPDGCREIFLLSRNMELTYPEIASRLSISVNTVKTQMKIAIARLKDDLKEYLPIVIVFFLLKNL